MRERTRIYLILSLFRVRIITFKDIDRNLESQIVCQEHSDSGTQAYIQSIGLGVHPVLLFPVHLERLALRPGAADTDFIEHRKNTTAKRGT